MSERARDTQTQKNIWKYSICQVKIRENSNYIYRKCPKLQITHYSNYIHREKKNRTK